MSLRRSGSGGPSRSSASSSRTRCNAYSDVPLHHDGGYFVRLTGINSTVASAAILGVIAILSVPLICVAIQTLRTEGFGG